MKGDGLAIKWSLSGMYKWRSVLVFEQRSPRKKWVTAGGVDTRGKELRKCTHQWMTNDEKKFSHCLSPIDECIFQVLFLEDLQLYVSKAVRDLRGKEMHSWEESKSFAVCDIIRHLTQQVYLGRLLFWLCMYCTNTCNSVLLLSNRLFSCDYTWSFGVRFVLHLSCTYCSKFQCISNKNCVAVIWKWSMLPWILW